MNKKVILSADATCDLGKALCERYHVQSIAPRVVLEGKEYLDNIDITADELFQAYWERKVLPKTTAINASEYLEHFKPWLEKGYEIIHITISSGISAGYQNCVLASESVPGIYPVDSLNLSSGIGLLVIEAALLIEKGLSASEIQAKLCDRRQKIRTSFILGNLQFMHAGGRCSAVAALGANLLNLKACIEMSSETGKMNVGKKYRGDLKTVLPKYVKDRLEAYDNIYTDRIFITHTGIDEKLLKLVQKAIEETLSFQEIFITRASCTISSHCGPNTLGILFLSD